MNNTMKDDYESGTLPRILVLFLDPKNYKDYVYISLSLLVMFFLAFKILRS